MFVLCQAMEFKHLPMAGGLLDQHPDLLDRFMYIFTEQQKEDKLKEQREKRKSGRGSPNKMGSRSSY